MKPQSFIDETIYDFQTIEYSLEFGRTKETIPVLLKMLERVRSSGLLPPSFWGQDLCQGMKIDDFYAKIKELARDPLAVSDKALEEMEYRQYIGQLRSLVFDNIYQLRQSLKSPSQKNIELALLVLSASAIGACLAVMVFLRFFLQDLGLKGDFFAGQNFERHVSSGYSKTINFGDFYEMDAHMPYEHSSARWQGSLLVPKDGVYTFFLLVDDGTRLYIDGEPVIDKWQEYDSVEFNKTMSLSKGEHDIRIDFFNDRYRSVLRLYWSFDNHPKTIIPAWNLRHKH